MTGARDAEDYRTVAERLGMTPAAVKTAGYRMRKRYRELLLSEIAQTVSSAEEVQDELRFLFQACRVTRSSQTRKPGLSLLRSLAHAFGRPCSRLLSP